ncbi:hypothetical protein [uncultured Sulfitobacter sp.]|uniref:hypothetical protein n=1 Tax=uncultured Sulfitobacter sp. TaxID=191468 RepID=UPI00263325E3|nr:hypothetical protein [uncultured Sulfitobacter sp.]
MAEPELVSAVEARTVVVDTANLAVPSANEIIVDLPSARHASRYQQGDVNGLRYVLFPNGSGKIMRAEDTRSVLYRLSCTTGISCIITGVGAADVTVKAVNAPKPAMPVAPDGDALARYLAQWVLAGTGSAPQELKADDPSVEPAPVIVTAAPALDTAQEDEPVENAAKVSPAPVNKIAKPSKSAPKLPAASRKKDKPISVRVSEAAKPVSRTAVQNTPEVTQSAAPEKTFFQRINLACSITGSVTLRYRNHKTGSERFGKPRASLGCGAKLSEKLSLRLSIIGYADKHEKSPSDAEFTYAITYRATDKITLGYSNYSGRFDNSSSAFVDSLTSGTLRASYKLPRISLPNEKTIGCSASIGLPNPKDTTANLTCSYAVTDKLRISGTAYAYFSGKQESYDADFAYSASYRVNDDWSVTYSNYANNRFFWNRSNSSGEGLLGGTVSVSYKFKF